MIGDLIPGFDVFDRPDLDHVFDEINFGVGPAGMVDVARPVSAAGAVDRPAGVDFEKIAGIELVGDLGRNLAADVANDELSLLDRDPGEETQPSFGLADPEMARR